MGETADISSYRQRVEPITEKVGAFIVSSRSASIDPNDYATICRTYAEALADAPITQAEPLPEHSRAYIDLVGNTVRELIALDERHPSLQGLLPHTMPLNAVLMASGNPHVPKSREFWELVMKKVAVINYLTADDKVKAAALALDYSTAQRIMEVHTTPLEPNITRTEDFTIYSNGESVLIEVHHLKEKRTREEDVIAEDMPIRKIKEVVDKERHSFMCTNAWKYATDTEVPKDRLPVQLQHTPLYWCIDGSIESAIEDFLGEDLESEEMANTIILKHAKIE